MLFDRRWEVKTNADPLTLTALIAWLETKPAGLAYRYIDNKRCLAAQYNKHVRREYCGSGADPRGTFDQQLEWIAWGGLDADRTFGAALKRARALENAS